MLIETQEDVTRAVLAGMEGTPDARTREILQSLVRHLHGFIRETRLTERDVKGPWYSIEFDFTIEAGEAGRPRAPITAKAVAV